MPDVFGYLDACKFEDADQCKNNHESSFQVLHKGTGYYQDEQGRIYSASEMSITTLKRLLMLGGLKPLSISTFPELELLINQANTAEKFETCLWLISSFITDGLRTAYSQMLADKNGIIEVYKVVTVIEWLHEIRIELAQQEPQQVEITEAKAYIGDSKFTTEVRGRITIEDILRKYNIKIRGKMACCPFHDDKDPSLSFDNETGLWFCFGCNARGNMITLVDRLQGWSVKT